MKRNSKIIITLFIILLLIATASGIFLYRNLRGAGAELGFIEVTIDGQYANITAEMEIKPDLDPDDIDMDIEIEREKIPVSYNGSFISAGLDESQFRKILDRDTMNITGNVEVPLLGPFGIDRSVKEEVNISFIREMVSTLNVSGVDVNFSFYGVEVFFLIDAEVERDFSLHILNTPAKLTSPGGSFKATVLELHFTTGEGGYARVSMPPITALGLAVYYRDVLIESWGIEARVSLPLFNG